MVAEEEFFMVELKRQKIDQDDDFFCIYIKFWDEKYLRGTTPINSFTYDII